MRSLGVVIVSLALGAACWRGPHLERNGTTRTAASGSVFPSASASASAGHDPDDTVIAMRWVSAAMGCFSGGAWVEALGSVGEERSLATLGRCRTLVTEPLGKKADDAAALAAVRAMLPEVVDAIAVAIEKNAPPKRRARVGSLIRTYGAAAREALLARTAAEAARAGKPFDEAALSARDALAKLHGEKGKLARVAALVVAADRLESSRGLDAKSKALAASPTFQVVFGVNGDSFDESARKAAKVGGHPVDDKATGLPLMIAIASAFADRFEALEPTLPANEARDVAAGYARRLRQEIAEAKPKGA